MAHGTNLYCCNPGSTFTIRLGTGYSKPKITDASMPNNIFVNLNIHIKGEIEIDAQTTFKNCTILVDEGSSIRVSGVPTSNSLAVYDCMINSCDDAMWYGISLEQNTTIILLNSTIKDAENAILLGGRNIIAIDNSIFEDNYIGIYAPPAAPNPSLKPYILVRYLMRSTFRTGGGLKDPYDLMETTSDGRGLAGIYLNDVPFFLVGPANSSWNITTNNEFDDLHAGVIGNYTSLLIRNSDFIDIEHVAVDETSSNLELDNAISMNGIGGFHFLDQRGEGPGVLNFSDCQRGIYTRNIMDVDIENNYFRTPKLGIHLREGVIGGKQNLIGNKIVAQDHAVDCQLNANLENILIGENEIKQLIFGTATSDIGLIDIGSGPKYGVNIQNNDITINQNGEASSIQGIRILSTEGFEVQNNYLTTNDENDPAKTLTYFYFAESPFSTVMENTLDGLENDGWEELTLGILNYLSPNSKFYCNTIDDVGYGYSHFGNNDGTNIANNYFHDNGIGMWYPDFSSNGPRQINVANQWVGSSYTQAARSDIQMDVIATFSGFDVHDDELPWFPDPVYEEAGSWFYHENMLNEPSNLCADPGNITPPTDDDFYIMIIDDYPEMDFQSGQQYWAQWHLYGSLSRDSSLTTDTDIWTWYGDRLSGNLGKYYHIHQLIKEPMRDYPGFYTNAQTIMSDKREMVTLYQEIGEDYYTTPDSLWGSIDTAMLVVVDSIATLNEAGIDYYHLWDSLLHVIKDDAQTILSTSSPANLIDSNLVKVLNIHLNTVFVGIDTFTTTQKNQLLNISDQCIYMGGPGVLMARMLLQTTKTVTTTWDDDALCFPTEPLISDLTEVSNNHSVLFPNPAENNLTISSLGHKIVQVRVLSMAGKTLIHSVTVGSEEFVMDISTLYPGAYLIEVVSEDGNVSMHKVIKK